MLSLNGVEFCPTLKEAVGYSKVIVGPVPLSSDRKRLSSPFGRNEVGLEEFIKELKGKYLIAGNINIKDELDSNEIQFVDLLKREEFSVLNTIATAEGAKVYCEARKDEDISWIKAYGYNPIHLNNLDEYLGRFDIIINTIPFQILEDKN